MYATQTIDNRPGGFHSFYLNTDTPMCFAGLDGAIRSSNAAFTRTFGAGRTLIPGARALCGETNLSCEQTCRRSDGTRWRYRMDIHPSGGESCQQHGGDRGVLVAYHLLGVPNQADGDMRRAEERYQSIFNNAVEGIFQSTPEGRYIDVNPSLVRLYGFSSRRELIEHYSSIKDELYVDPKRRIDFIRIMENRHEVVNFESQIRRKDGSVIWISENARPVYDATGKLVCFEGTVMDITRRKQTEEALEDQREHFRQLFENSPQAIVLIDIQRNVVDANPGFENLFGYRREDISGFGVRPLIVPDELLDECENYRNCILSGESLVRETQRRHKDGRLIPVSMIGFLVRERDRIAGIYYVYQDISERKAFEAQITHQAFHDGLTGLPNRLLFSERLAHAIRRAGRDSSQGFAVLMLDLDRFKDVNDTLGHQAGDELLVGVARRLEREVRQADTVARLGGDEFALILERTTCQEEVRQIAKRILSALRRPMRIGGKTVHPMGSFGVVAHAETYPQAEDILRDADIAMYRAKENHKGLLFFDKEMHESIVESVTLEAELRQAIHDNGLLLHFQPIVCVPDQKICGFEALVRWPHARRGLVPPDKFIPLAEETGLIIPLGNWVITESLRQLHLWRETLDQCPKGLSINVNVSNRQFGKAHLVEHIADELERFALPPRCLKIEITESLLMQNPEAVLRELEALKELGVQLAIDDFGTGYSSLSYLQQMPVDSLKIDRSFISGEESRESCQIVESIIAMAQSLGLEVVAEGVETKGQLHRLQGMACAKAQGYMFSRPVDAEQVAELLRESS
jgi:Amt family ammonium transporter